MTVRDTIYRESYFKGTPFFNEEIPPSRLGVPGEPIPYSIAGDDLVTVTLVFCILVSMATMARSWRLICFQTKNLLRMPRENSVEMRETADEMRYQTYFCLQGVILLGLLAFSTVSTYSDGEFTTGHYTVLGIYCAIFAAYYMMREALMIIVHTVFFDKKQRRLDNLSRLYIMAVQGAVLLPLVMLHVYFQLSIETTLKLLSLILVVLYLLHFYKVFNIFFRKKNAFLQFLLYLCTLEAVPLALLAGITFAVSIYLTHNI